VPYLKWLQVLIALGPKLPAILAALQALFDAIASAIPAPAGSAEGSLQVVQPSTAELEAEQQVAALVAGPNAAFDGSRLRALFTFLQATGLLDALLKRLGG
jgi:hypothetical protein